LFYLAGNPPCGSSLYCGITFRNTTSLLTELNNTSGLLTEEKKTTFLALLDNGNSPSYSWWILFVCVRHALLITLAAITQAVIVDFLCIRSKIILNLAGPAVTLYTVQSKGMPFILSFWGIYSFLFLYGEDRFANHWLFWQHVIDMFNATNPSGGITSLDSYKKMIMLALLVGVATSLKRFWVALLLGKQTYHRYASDLANLMRKILLIGKLAGLGKEMEKYGSHRFDFSCNRDFYVDTIRKELRPENEDCPLRSMKSDDETLLGADNLVGRTLGYSTQSSTRMKIEKLLGAWEEPKEVSKRDVSISIDSHLE
jgi:hypothetical protein